MTPSWQLGTIRPAAIPAPPGPAVVKLGGSLLVRPGWPAEIAALLSACQRPLVVVGGGAVVDGLRAIDAASPRPPALVHALAIDAMNLTTRIVADALGLAIVVNDDADGGVLDAAAWLADGHPARLPAGWQVTSDSIAALVAAVTGRRLLLAKSVPPPGGDLRTLAAAGWVDEHFPAAAVGLGPIDWAAPA